MGRGQKDWGRQRWKEAGRRAGHCPHLSDACVPSRPCFLPALSLALEAAPRQGCRRACPARRVWASVRGVGEMPDGVLRGQGSCIPRKPPPSLGRGCSRGPRDLAADIPQRPRGSKWQGQLQTGAEPALFPGWHPLSIRPCSAPVRHCLPPQGSVGSWHSVSSAMSA